MYQAFRLAELAGLTLLRRSTIDNSILHAHPQDKISLQHFVYQNLQGINSRWKCLPSIADVMPPISVPNCEAKGVRSQQMLKECGSAPGALLTSHKATLETSRRDEVANCRSLFFRSRWKPQHKDCGRNRPGTLPSSPFVVVWSKSQRL